MRADLTKHSIERGEERLGLNLEAFQRTADIALANGIKHSDASGRLKKFMDGVFLSNRTANNMRIYGEFLYLFRNADLITVINVPNQFKPLVAKLRNKLTP